MSHGPESERSHIPLSKRKRSIRWAYSCSMSSTVAATCLTAAALQLFLIQRGADDLYLGALSFTIWSAGFFLPLGINQMEKHGKIKVLSRWWIVSTVGMMLMPVLPAISHRYHQTDKLILLMGLLLVFMRSVGEGVGGAGWFPLLQDNVPRRITGKFFAIFRTYWQAIALVMGLTIAYALGKNSQWWKFSVIFAIGAIAMIIRWISVQFMSENPPKAEPDGIGMLKRIRECLANKHLRTFLKYILVYDIAAMMCQPFQIKMLKNFNYSDGYVIAATSMVSLGAIISLKFWGKIADRFGNRAVFSFSHMGMIFATLLWIRVDDNTFSYVLVFVLYFIWSVFNSGNGIAQTRYMMNYVPSEKQSYIVVINTVTNISIAFAPLLAGSYLRISKNLHLDSGAITMNNYHLLYITAALLFIYPHAIRKELRGRKELPSSEVFTLVTKPLRLMFGTFVRVPSVQAQIKHQQQTKNDQNMLDE